MKKTLIVGVGTLALLSLAAAFLFNNSIAGLASVIASQQTTKYADCIRSFSEASHNNFTAREVELNGDTHTDALIAYTDDASCGNAGCIYEICMATTEHTFTHVPFSYAAKSITVSQTRTNDMYDLILNEDKSLTMVWDGTQYILQE